MKPALRWCAALAMLAGGCGSSAPRTTQSTTTSTAAAPVTTTTAAPPAPTTAPPTSTIVPPPADAVSDEAALLQSTLDGFVAKRTPQYGIVAVDLKNGARASVNASVVMWSASLYKLYVAEEILRRLVAGTLSRGAPAGDAEHRTVGDCLQLMIVVSSDDCGVALLAMVGRERHDAALHAEGFTGTYLGTPQRTTAADVAAFFTRVYQDRLVSPAVSAELLGLLTAQQVNDRISLAIPPGVVVAHKTGDRIGWAHDAGIVYAPKSDFLLVVMSGRWPSSCCQPSPPGRPPPPAFRTITEVADRVYRLFAA